MTYCIGMRLNKGLVFLSDSRTNAGVDQIGTFRKMTVFERPGERVLVLLTAGNLGITQAVRQELVEPPTGVKSLWEAPTLYEGATLVGAAVRKVFDRDGEHLKEMGIEFNCAMILGGQIQGERPRLFHIYAAGNFIEAQDENLYFQIGEAKYGKPIVDRVVTPSSTLEEAAKCALVSMDSTLRSNISVGLPLDLLCYDADSLHVTRFVTIDNDNAYFQMVRRTWGQRLKQVFTELPDPSWTASETGPSTPVRAPLPPHRVPPDYRGEETANPPQTFAGDPPTRRK